MSTGKVFADFFAFLKKAIYNGDRNQFSAEKQYIMD